LDALRKSEHERRRGLLPGVAHVPYALPRAALPVWVPVAIGVLAAALVVTGFAWWYTTRPVADGSARIAASADFLAPQSSAPAPAPAWTAPPRVGEPTPSTPLSTEQRAATPAPGSARLAVPASPPAAERSAAPLSSATPTPAAATAPTPAPTFSQPSA